MVREWEKREAHPGGAERQERVKCGVGVVFAGTARGWAGLQRVPEREGKTIPLAKGLDR